MANASILENAIPVAPLALIVFQSADQLGASVNHYLVQFRKSIPPFRDIFPTIIS